MKDSRSDQPDLPRVLPAALGASPVAAEAPAPEWEGDEEQKTNYRRLFSAVGRHKWLIVLLTIVGAGVGFGLTRLVQVQYLAQATLWIQVDDQGHGAGASGPIQPAELLQMSSWVDLLRSFVVLDEVVRHQRLYLERHDDADSAVFTGLQLKPSFVPANYDLTVSRDGRTFVLRSGDREVQRGNVGDSVGPALGLAWVPSARELRAGREVRFRVRTPRDAALILRDDLKAVLPEQGSFMRLELTGSSPSITAATVNEIAERFADVAAELKKQKLTELSRILQDQLTSAYADLGRAERALETFRVHTITLPSEQASPVAPGLAQTNDPVYRTYFDMRISRDQLERDRQLLARALSQPDSEVSAMELEAIPSVRESSELSQALTLLASKQADARAMRLQFGDSYPPLRQLNSELADLRLRTVPNLARQLATELTARVQDMDARIGSASKELQQIPPRVIEEGRLRRDVDIASTLYTTLQARYEEARLGEVSSIPDVRILDRAVPPDQPLKNRAMMLLLGGVFGGLGVGVAFAILRDRIDRRFRYPEQVTHDMGLPILGALPRLKNGGGRAGAPAEAQVVEALRSIRLNLEHAYGAAGPLVTTITSPGSGDGKSFLASNLALSFADAGHRTLVIDADIRRGSLHRVFGLQRKPGLLDCLTGHASSDEIVQRSAIAGVEFIGSGTRRNAGPELLASAAMSQLLIGLRNAYGVIILDSAPLGAGVDPLVLGALCGSMVLVLRAGVTDREFTMAKLDAVSRLPIRVLGAVLNDLKPEGADRYYYSYSYLPGYETSEETAAHDPTHKALRKTKA